MDDWLDVVDENDNIIGKERFWKCHGRGGPHLPHRISAILVFKDDSFQETLITKRSATVMGPNLWDSPAGHVESGEIYVENAKKELQEEVFHEHEMPNMEFEELFKIKIPKPDSFEFATIFRVIYPGPFYNYEEEITDFKFIKVDTLIDNINKNTTQYTECFKIIIKTYLEQIHSKL
ncbi:MAG: NUDIX hydrolase [archaeon]